MESNPLPKAQWRIGTQYRAMVPNRRSKSLTAGTLAGKSCQYAHNTSRPSRKGTGMDPKGVFLRLLIVVAADAQLDAVCQSCRRTNSCGLFGGCYTKRANNNNEVQRSEPCPVSLDAGRRGGNERRDRRSRMRPGVGAEERRKRSVRNAS